MIKQSGDFSKSITSNMRGGKGDIVRMDIFSEDDMLKKARFCAILKMPAGTSIGEHPHGPDAEIYYILSGTLRVTDNGVTKDLVVGDLVFTGGGTTHSVVNVSEEEASLLAIIIN